MKKLALYSLTVIALASLAAAAAFTVTYREPFKESLPTNAQQDQPSVNIEVHHHQPSYGASYDDSYDLARLKDLSNNSDSDREQYQTEAHGADQTKANVLLEEEISAPPFDLLPEETLPRKLEHRGGRGTPPELFFDDKSPKMAIVIDDIGMNISRSSEVFDIDENITVSILAYAPNLKLWIDNARNNNFEMMLHLPMEPRSKTIDPGPIALKLANNKHQIEATLDRALARFASSGGLPVAVNNHMGSAFTANLDKMQITLRHLNKHNLPFLDSLTTGRSVAETAARKEHVPFLVRDVFLDNQLDPAKIRRQLQAAVKVAKTKGWAVAIGHPYAETVAAIKEWIPSAKAQGIQFVSISELFSALASQK